jgi:predicted transcriptional regulator
MNKRKTVIELQSKPENKNVRQIIQKTKPVEFAPISPLIPNLAPEESADEAEKKPPSQKSQSAKTKAKSTGSKIAQQVTPKTANKESSAKREAEENSLASGKAANPQTGRLRIFQASTPVTRTLTKFQKAAIVVRGENGKQLIELLWRDQMNEKTKDIWDYLCGKFGQAEEQKTNEVTIRKRDILEGSGVKSDRTFISAIYTLEDMGLIEVRRLSGNKEGNIYVLTEEGREEMESYRNIRK